MSILAASVSGAIAARIASSALVQTAGLMSLRAVVVVVVQGLLALGSVR